MKHFKTIFLIVVFLLIASISYSFEKLDFFDNFHIYTPYIYILQDDTNIDTAKVLILFHDYKDLKNTKKSKKEKKDKKKNKDNNNSTDKKDNNDTDNINISYDFAAESAKWEAKAETERFFIMGFDFWQYESFFDEKNLNKINERVLMEVDRIKTTCNTKEIKIYVAGSQFGGNIALLFNLIYDNYDGALCMNILKPTKDIMKKLNQYECENKKFYFFHCEKNKSISASKINSLETKLKKKGAFVETIIYKNDKNNFLLPDRAYFDAIDKIK